MRVNTPAVIAAGFFVAWIAILYAGADHPPPIGFLWLVPFVFSCAVAVYLRFPVYQSWSGSGRPGRTIKVLIEGIVAGIVVALTALLIRSAVGPEIFPERIGDVLTWLAVLATLGAANAITVYSVAAVLSGRPK